MPNKKEGVQQLYRMYTKSVKGKRKKDLGSHQERLQNLE